MRTQVCIIGGGPSGLLLARMLHNDGIEAIVLERHDRDHVLARIRAGVLEWSSVETLDRAGVGRRMHAEGTPHGGTYLSAQNRGFRVDYEALTGKRVMVYGQTEVTHDLYDAMDAEGTPVLHGVAGVTIGNPDSDAPFVTFRHQGADRRIDCDWIAGCDGYHGVSRDTIPANVLKTFEKIYPFGWLGVLSETPPVSHELIYANHERGFALCSQRNAMLSRYYLQVALDDQIEAWSDTRFWDELRRRIPEQAADSLVTGPSIEKSIAPLRSFVAEPMRWGRLCLVGDAAHIVPPTGAKGLNLAVGDVHYLHDALTRAYAGDPAAIDRYSETALVRVWKAIRFSWWMTSVLHKFPGQTPFEQRIQEAEINLLEVSDTAKANLAENYVGLPF